MMNFVDASDIDMRVLAVSWRRVRLLATRSPIIFVTDR